jgi:hypothetical protein
LTASASASDDTAAFEKLKGLAGTWKGTAHVGGGTSPAAVVYRVVSGGSVVEEAIAPHSDHEMITMYYLDGKSLVLTHYCTMGNQPHMKLTAGADSTKLEFGFDGGSNITAEAGHMHSMNLRLLGTDHIQTQWMAMMGGKPMMHIEMDLHRAANSAR